MTIPEILLAVVVAAWWLVSLLAQFQARPIKNLRYRDVLHLIPSWRFFAPAPGCRDYHLEFRVRKRGLAEADIWRRVRLNPPRDWRCTFLNPGKRRKKAFSTAVHRILHFQHEYGYDGAARSLAYLQILYFLQQRFVERAAVELQFRIVSGQDFARDCRSWLHFTSSWHLQENSRHESGDNE